MNLKKWSAIAIVVVFASSCGENSTKDQSSTTDTTVTAPVTTTPVTETFPVPEPVKTTFAEKYPTVKDATWSRYEPVDKFDWEWSGWPAMDTSDYMVRFNWDGTDHWAWYDNDNSWIGSVSTVSDYTSLPAAVNKAIEKDFAGYTIVAVDKEYDKKRTAYEVDLAKGDDTVKALIAEDGTVIKKKANVGGERTKEKNL